MNQSRFKYLSLFSLLGWLLLTNCGNEGVKEEKDLILGRWEIQEAYRNGRVTESLAELYFEFFQDGKMTTNILGTPETATYELDGSQVRQREGQLDINYQVEELTDSTLILATELQGFAFRFSLHRDLPED